MVKSNLKSNIRAGRWLADTRKYRLELEFARKSDADHMMKELIDRQFSPVLIYVNKDK
jgi:hypothetical protein